MPDEDKDSQEKRHYERVTKKATIVYHHIDDITNQEDGHLAELCDFSGGGARFITDELLLKNSQLMLNLNFDGWQIDNEELVWTGKDEDVGKLKALGQVMWCSQKDTNETYEIGVRFIGRVQ